MICKKKAKKELERNVTITLNFSASIELSTSLKKVSLLMKSFGGWNHLFFKGKYEKAVLFSYSMQMLSSFLGT